MPLYHFLLLCILVCRTDLFSFFLHEPSCVPCLRLAVLVLPFVGIKNCIHGYCLGIENSGVPAFSLCLEQISRVSSIFLLSVFMIEKMPVPAFLAVCGMTVGEIVSFFFTLIFYFLHKKSADSLSKSTLSASKLSVFHELLSLGIPLTLNSFSVTLLQSVQSIMIPMMLYRFLWKSLPQRRDLWHLKRHGIAFYHVSFYDHQCIIFDASA